MKLFAIIHEANQNLWRNKLRSFLTILAIFVGSFAIISTTAIQAGVNNFIDEQVNAYGGESYLNIMPGGQEETINTLLGMSQGEVIEYDPEKKVNSISFITPDQIEQLKQIDGIDPDSLTPFNITKVDYITNAKNGKKFILDTMAMMPGQVHIATTAGRTPENNNDEYEVLLPTKYPQAMGYTNDEDVLGEKVTIAYINQFTQEEYQYEATVVGVAAPGIVTTGRAILNRKLDADIYEKNTEYYPKEQKEAVYVMTASYDTENYSIEDIREKIEDLGLMVNTVKDIVGSIKSFFDIIIVIFQIFGYIALIAAAIGIINTLFMSVQERTREIGLDKALGMSSIRVFLNFSFEAIMLGFWGSALGIVASMIIGGAVNNWLHSDKMILSEFPTFNLVEYPIQNIVTIMVLIMTIAFISGTAPARQAAHKNPIDALRYE